MEPIYRQTFTIEPFEVDCFGRAKASMLLRFAQEVAGHHSDLLGLTYDALAAQGLFWAVIRNRITISRLPMLGETITLETWPMPTTRTAYPRSTVAYDQQGNEIFRGVSLWILMDHKTRAMVLPGKSGVIVEGILRGNELAAPRSIAPKALEQVRKRTVCFTDLDRNQHMNNARYLDWIDDLLPAAFHQDHPMADLTLCYLNEAREGQELELHWGMDETGSVLVDIHRQKEGDYDRIFSARIVVK
ncbi:MAG: hypothetical protein IJV82_03135 [Oscillospiraceae bacterium]|nr:hypothetical protein [Oscillospiraceae bacterium]